MTLHPVLQAIMDSPDEDWSDAYLAEMDEEIAAAAGVKPGRGVVGLVWLNQIAFEGQDRTLVVRELAEPQPYGVPVNIETAVPRSEAPPPSANPAPPPPPPPPRAPAPVADTRLPRVLAVGSKGILFAPNNAPLRAVVPVVLHRREGGRRRLQPTSARLLSEATPPKPLTWHLGGLPYLVTISTVDGAAELDLWGRIDEVTLLATAEAVTPAGDALLAITHPLVITNARGRALPHAPARLIPIFGLDGITAGRLV